MHEPVEEPEPAAEEVKPAVAPEGARLLALKMALDGRPRDETAAYLRENFELDDPEALLDEVYAARRSPQLAAFEHLFDPPSALHSLFA